MNNNGGGYGAPPNTNNYGANNQGNAPAYSGRYDGPRTSYNSNSNIIPDIGDLPTMASISQDPYVDAIKSLRQQKIAPRPRIPADFNRRPRWGIIQIGKEGNILHDKISLPEAANKAAVVTDIKQLIDPNLQAILTPQQLAALEERPQTILASDLAPMVFNCQRLLLLMPQTRSGFSAIDVNLRTLEQHQVYASPQAGQNEAYASLIEKAMQSADQVQIPVVSNQDSRLYHRTDAEHLSKTSPQTRYDSGDIAKRYGLKPCPLCFPESNYLEDKYEAKATPVPDNMALSQDMQATRDLTNVAARVLDANDLFSRGYRVYLLASPEYNAFSYVGGPTYISEGLLRLLESPGEIAAIVSHELAHLSLGHVTLRPPDEEEKLRQEREAKEKRRSRGVGSMIPSIVGSVVGYTTGNYWMRWGAEGLARVGQNIKISFPKHQEEEADRAAVLMSFKAGYSPEDYVITVSKMGSAAAQNTSNPWLMSHKDTQKRLDNIRTLTERLGEMEIELRKLQRVDANLSYSLRSQAQIYCDNPQKFRDFIAAYARLYNFAYPSAAQSAPPPQRR